VESNAYRYEFRRGVSLNDVEESLMLAVLAVECLHGRSRLRLDAAFRLDKENRCCVVDARSEVGRGIARIFTGFLTREFGEEAFTVKRTGAAQKGAALQTSAAGGRHETL